jgi:hypothetical protein
MTVTVRAHFDGRAIIPDEPLQVPVNQPLEVQVTVRDGPPERSLQAQDAAIDSLDRRADQWLEDS